jgi:hypothetical protein
MNRIAEYDSDIWNNTDVFTEPSFAILNGKLGSLYCATYDVLCQVASNIQTCTLLSPSSYCNMLMRNNRGVEYDSIQMHILDSDNNDTINGFADRELDVIYEKEVKEITSLRNISSSLLTIANIKSAKFAIVENDMININIHDVIRAGCVPIYIRQEGDDVFWNNIHNTLSLIELKDGKGAAKLITILLNNPDKWTIYRDGLMNMLMKL